jgi:hypothetical protein
MALGLLTHNVCVPQVMDVPAVCTALLHVCMGAMALNHVLRYVLGDTDQALQDAGDHLLHMEHLAERNFTTCQQPGSKQQSYGATISKTTYDTWAAPWTQMRFFAGKRRCLPPFIVALEVRGRALARGCPVAPAILNQPVSSSRDVMGHRRWPKQFCFVALLGSLRLGRVYKHPTRASLCECNRFPI